MTRLLPFLPLLLLPACAATSALSAGINDALQPMPPELRAESWEVRIHASYPDGSTRSALYEEVRAPGIRCAELTSLPPIGEACAVVDRFGNAHIVVPRGALDNVIAHELAHLKQLTDPRWGPSTPLRHWGERAEVETIEIPVASEGSAG